METEVETKKRIREEAGISQGEAGANSTLQPQAKKARTDDGKEPTESQTQREEEREGSGKSAETIRKEMKERLVKLIDELDIKEEEVSKLTDIVEDERHPDHVFGLVKRSEVHMKREFGEVVLCEFENCDCDGAAIIESFPSIGLVGVLTGKQIVKTLKLPLIGVIQLESLEAACVVSHEQPSYPARIYGNKKLVVFLCEMAFRIPPDAIHSVVQCIYDFAHRHRSPMVYAIEGMPKPHLVQLPSGEEIEIRLNAGGPGEDEEEGDAEQADEKMMLIDDSLLTRLTVRQHYRERTVQIENGTLAEDEKKSPGKTQKKKKTRRKSGTDEEEKEPGLERLADKLFGDKLHYVTTDSEVAKTLRGLGHIPVLDGVIPGVVGALLAEAPLRHHPEVTGLLAPTSLIFPDPDSALQVLQLLDSLQPGLQLDKAVLELEQDVASLKKMLQGLMRNLSTDLRNNLTGLRKSGNVPSGMYQ